MQSDQRSMSELSALSMEIVEITEATAIAAAKLRGRGDEEQADEAAIETMHAGLSSLPIDGEVIIGEGQKNEAPLLYVGETLGQGGQSDNPIKIDIATDPLEGTTYCAKSQQGALSVLALGQKGSLMKLPQIYMDKIAIGPGYEPGLIDLDNSVKENLEALAKAKGVSVNNITACILDRPRHGKLIDEVRSAGAAIRLVADGDIAGIINTTRPDETFIDIYLGLGGALEGILAAAALRSTGGQMQGRLAPLNSQDHERALAAGVQDIKRKYDLNELVSGDVIFCATGITNSPQMHGVKFAPDKITTQSLLMCSPNKSSRKISTEHRSTA